MGACVTGAALDAQVVAAVVIALSAMGRFALEIDTLVAAQRAAGRTDAFAVDACLRRQAHHIASAAMERVGGVVDAPAEARGERGSARDGDATVGGGEIRGS